MKKFNTTIATLSIAAAGVFVVAGAAKADSTHYHAYNNVPHTHGHQQHNGQAIGNAIVIGGLLLGGIALLDALNDNGNLTVTTHGHYHAPKPAPKPVILYPAPKPKPKPIPVVHAPKPPKHVNFTTSCRDHGHIAISWDGPREFSLRRPNGSKLKTINAGRPVMRKVANAMHQFGLDTTCVVKTNKNGQTSKTRFFLKNGWMAKVPANWAGADKIVRFNADNLVINKVNNGKFRVEKPNGQWIQTLPTRKQARAFIAYLDDMGANKKVIIKNRNDKNKFAFYAR